MSTTIVCLIGESGSGKTTIARELEKKGFPVIDCYTTRSKRREGEWGHNFVTIDYLLDKYPTIDKDSNVMESIDKALSDDSEVATHTLYKDNFYWIVKDQYRDKKIILYTVDQQGYKSLTENIKGEANTISVYLYASRKNRLQRVTNRYREDSGSDTIKHEHVKKATERINNDDDHFHDMQYDYIIDTNKDIKSSIKDMSSILSDL